MKFGASVSSVETSKWTRDAEEFVRVKVRLSTCWTAQYSKSIPCCGMASMILAKSYEVILFWGLIK